jgi:hypothetical protein
VPLLPEVLPEMTRECILTYDTKAIDWCRVGVEAGEGVVCEGEGVEVDDVVCSISNESEECWVSGLRFRFVFWPDALLRLSLRSVVHAPLRYQDKKKSGSGYLPGHRARDEGVEMKEQR